MKVAWLVARREIATRIRQRATLIATAISLAIVVGLAVVAGVVSDDGPDRSTVVLAGGGSERIGDAARELAPRAGQTLELRTVADRSAAERALRDGDADAAVLDGRELLFSDEVDDALAATLQEASARSRAAEVLRGGGLGDERIRQALDPPPLAVATIEPASDATKEGVAFVVVLILFGQLITYGLAVATGVVEEKTSRIVEVLLATIRPSQLLAGKIAGIGLLGLAQVLLVTLAGAGAAMAMDVLDVGSDVLVAVVVAVGWFVLGYLLYATLFAVTGAIVPRQEELQSASAPLTLLITISYFLGFTALQSPDSAWATVAAYVPLSSPLVMPPLIVAGDASAADVAISLALLAGAIGVAIPLAARLYAGSVLQLRTRVPLGRAWRAARER